MRSKTGLLPVDCQILQETGGIWRSHSSLKGMLVMLADLLHVSLCSFFSSGIGGRM